MDTFVGNVVVEPTQTSRVVRGSIIPLLVLRVACDRINQAGEAKTEYFNFSYWNYPVGLVPYLTVGRQVIITAQASADKNGIVRFSVRDLRLGYDPAERNRRIMPEYIPSLLRHLGYTLPEGYDQEVVQAVEEWWATTLEQHYEQSAQQVA
ncbi:hypothetical protein [Nodosilinea nodulosa]|uniref:hypothetical protein n=1 Tax=Nodosilinea nodulosa TaxID=416001 RepID=UPI000311893F|nr:hypothetical protein [Nodosilinea nodulosa]